MEEAWKRASRIAIPSTMHADVTKAREPLPLLISFEEASKKTHHIPACKESAFQAPSVLQRTRSEAKLMDGSVVGGLVAKGAC